MNEKKKVEPYTPDWNDKANRLARSFAPRIKPCNDCGQPVVDGYCCNFCGSVNP